MSFRLIQREYQKFISLLLASIIAFAAQSAPEDIIIEKRTEAAMRMIGHEVLLCMGDKESLVMPIEKIQDSYKISFDFKFGIDPSDIVTIVDHVMMETQLATDYIVELKQCESKEVVHSFLMEEFTDPDMVACQGRILPNDCYYLLITLLNNDDTRAEIIAGSSDSFLDAIEKTKESSYFFSTILVVPLIFLIGFIGFYLKKKDPVANDPNVVLIGASRFDKRNMALLFENKKTELSNKEAELLSVLHTGVNVPIEREALLQKVWGDEGDYVGRTLDVFISKLRKKLEADTSVKIVNVRGVGYKLVMNV